MPARPAILKPLNVATPEALVTALTALNAPLAFVEVIVTCTPAALTGFSPASSSRITGWEASVMSRCVPRTTARQ